MVEKEEAKAKKKSVWPFVIIAIAVVLLFAVKGSFNEINDYFNPPPTEHVTVPADIELYKFDDLSNNKSVNVEVWVINIGEEKATNISMYVRVRSQNGTALFEGSVTLSTLILGQNETCTGDYTIVFKSNASEEQHLYHTIELTWDGGRHTYSKETY